MSLVLPVHVVISPDLALGPGRLADLQAKLADFSPVMEQIGAELEEGLAESFDNRGFGQWPRLKMSTIADKSRRGYSGQPDLVRSGTLYRALTQRGAKGHKFIVDSDRVTVGVYDDVVPYARWQAEGTKRGLPARVLIQVPPGTVERIIDILTDWLGGGPGVRVFADAPVKK